MTTLPGTVRRNAVRFAAASFFLIGSMSGQADMIDTEGMEPWEVCGLCHGYEGQSAMAKFPRLAGQKAAYIEKQLADIAAGRRTNEGGQMRSIMTEVAEEDYAAIAGWFASQESPEPEPAEGDADLGDTLWRERGCAACHIGEGAADGMTAPHLTAQHERYIKKQLTDFRDGERANDPDGVMRAQAADLNDEEIAALAAYLSSTARAGAAKK
jgi:cytochrome c553